MLVLVSEFLLSVEVPMTAKKEKKEKKTKGSVSFAGSDEETKGKGDKGTTGGGDDHDSPAHFRPGAGYFLVLFSAWCS